MQHQHGPIWDFVTESNRIEGIIREPTEAEVDATAAFIVKSQITIPDLVALVAIYQPNARLRDKVGLNVRVGSHIAPPGGAGIVPALQAILDVMGGNPWQTHVAYEILHPFTDGNGRSGRALWAWQMLGQQDGLPLGFLHQFYYQTLSAGRVTRSYSKQPER